MSKAPVIIVGGGLSGLAAGVFLNSSGVPVTLLEQKPYLGGRAYSYTDATTGDVVDNGQHVLIAGYEKTMAFLEMIGTKSLLSIQRRPELLFHHPERGFHELVLPRFPSPLHLMTGVLTCGLFTLSDRIKILRAGMAIRSFNEQSGEAISHLTISQWLDAVGQTDECKRSFWEPLAVSIMNEHIATASALVFIRSMQKAFLAGTENAALALPTVGLSELYVHRARDFIEQHGGRIFCGSDVSELLFDGERAPGVRLRGGETFECSALILAVPNTKIASLLPDALCNEPAFSSMASAETSPIVSIHLWFETDAMPHEFVALIGRRIQWVFNKRKINKESGKGGHVSAIISAANDFVGLSNDELIAIAVEDLRTAYQSFSAKPTHAVVIREKRATFSSTPKVERLRPPQKTPVPNLFLAGDWTETGYPATIEGAIISAQRCVDLIGRLLIRE